jgi:hypothetical protein
MRDWLNMTTFQATLVFGMVAIIGIAGFQFLRRLRHSTCKADTNATDWGADLEQMQRRGEIDEQEFRLITAELGKRDFGSRGVAFKVGGCGKRSG